MDEFTNEQKMLNNWYHHAAQLPGSVDALLKLLRIREGVTEEEQRILLGIDHANFSRLKAMRAPRPQFFASDARRIAAYCKLENENPFLSWMLLARNLGKSIRSHPAKQYYEAAFDARDDLDDVPEEHD